MASKRRSDTKAVRSYSNKRKVQVPQKKPQETTVEYKHKYYYCQHCDSGFDSETEVEVHSNISHKTHIKNLIATADCCYVCLKPFDCMEDLRAHVRKYHLFIENPAVTKINRPIFICYKCSTLFFNKNMLLYHLRLKHEYLPREHKTSCPKCDKQVTVLNLSQHMDFVHTRSIKTCPICIEKLPTVNALLEHVQKAHPPVFDCVFCRHRAKGRPELDMHLLEAHGRRASLCDSRGTRKLSDFFTVSDEQLYKFKLQFVDRQLNLRNMVYICVMCQEVCPTTVEMRRHLSENHGHSDLQHWPPRTSKACHCGASFRTEVLLKHHMFKEHVAGEPASNAPAPPDLEDDSSDGMVIAEDEDDGKTVNDGKTECERRSSAASSPRGGGNSRELD